MASLDASSSTQRAGGEINVAVEEEEEDPLPQLPFELLLNIVQRADAVTVVRCAATEKCLRGAILSPAFHPRLDLGVDPALLLGFSFWEHGRRRSIDTPPLPTGGGGQPRVRLDYDAIAGFKPVAWRDGLLLILRRHLGREMYEYDLRVCNALTSDVTASLPPITLPDKPSSAYPCKCNLYWTRRSSFVFLTADTGGRSFELLAANNVLQTQVFSSDRWEWDPVRHTSFPRYQLLLSQDHFA